MQEIERKFLVKNLPNLENLKPTYYERYFLFRSEKVENRIQKKWEKYEFERWEKYEFERKEKQDNLEAHKQKFEISREEFERLKSFSNEAIIREAYLISQNPEISLKIYHWKFEGFKRIEIEFPSKQEALDFVPYDWFGAEITDLLCWKDSKLLDLSDEEIKNLITQ
jgi:adenylate cyclase